MTKGKLFADGTELVPDKRLGKGGEGEVFSIRNRPGFAVKTYYPHLLREREPKVRAMVSNRLADGMGTVAFPHQVVVDGRGAFAGFVMRLVEKHKEIHELQTPASRQKHFPKADYRFLVRVAINIARVFAQVHATGCIIGDINQRGILVSPDATVALIDADSFQVTHGGRSYPCVVGVPEYTPPELQGKSGVIVRTRDHDGFGLAVCLFQLLCMDRHPFSGRMRTAGEMPLERAIAEYRFAYSERDTGLEPPPGAVLLGEFTPAVRRLFEESFSPQHAGRRPKATDWIAGLNELEAALRPCSRNKLHHYARNAAACPWCRMESEFGRPLFLDTEVGRITLPSGRLSADSGLVLDLPALLAAINAVPVPSSVTVSLPAVAPVVGPSATAIAVKAAQWYGPVRRFAGLAVLGVAAIGALAGVFPLILSLLGGGIGIWLFTASFAVDDRLTTQFRAEFDAMKKRVHMLQQTAPAEKLLRAKAKALDAIDGYRKLSEAYGSVKADHDRRRRQLQLDSFLASHPVRTAGIPKLSSADIAALASYGITTASDAKQRDVLQVYGIGPVKAGNISSWISKLESRFQFQAAYSDEDRRQIRQAQSDIILKQQGEEERIKRLIEELQTDARAFEGWRQAQDPELWQHCQRLKQAEADLHYANLPVPDMPPIVPSPLRSVESFRRGLVASNGSPGRPTGPVFPVARGAIVCPQCRGPMVRRLARRGRRAGRPFWGCSRYPSCSGTRPI